MLHADGIVLFGTRRREEVEKKREEWRRAMEDRGHTTSRKETVYLRFRQGDTRPSRVEATNPKKINPKSVNI